MNSFVLKYGKVMFIAITVGSNVAQFFVDTPFNAPYIWAFRQLALPIFVIGVGFILLNHREFIAHTSRTKVYATAFLFILSLVVLSGGWINLLNAVCGDGPAISYEGPVQRKFETHGRPHGWCIEILDESHNAPITFEVSPEVYAAKSVGEHYHRSMRTGCFGIPYEIRNRWKVAF